MGFLPLMRQRRFYALGAWTQHVLFCGVHLAGNAAVATVAAKCPRRFRLLVWPVAVVCGIAGGMATFYHWQTAKEIAQEL